jgi:hypothetical protein
LAREKERDDCKMMTCADGPSHVTATPITESDPMAFLFVMLADVYEQHLLIDLNRR